jgi:hypothetical protein
VGDGKHSRRQKPTRREIRRDRNEACTSEQEPDERPGEMGTRQAERWSTAHGINVALESLGIHVDHTSLLVSENELTELAQDVTALVDPQRES